MLILNHRVGQGDFAADDVIRATLVRLANGLAKGPAGVRPELAEHVVRALNAGELPRVRTLGSVGQSDLPQMADVAHGLLGDFNFTLAAKEGIALVNNSAFSTASAALAVADCTRLLDVLDVAGALDLEGLCQQMDRGLLITEQLGHGVNPVTGDYSRGAAGFWIENGGIAYPVEEITIAGNLKQMFRDIVAVGRDVDRRGSRHTGSILIAKMTVAGQ